MKKIFSSNNILIAIQAIIFFLGVALMWADGSKGMIEDMTSLSVFGIILIISGIAFQWILAGISSLFKKKE